MSVIKEGENQMKEMRVYCRDCLDGFGELRSSSVDLIVTSPPYNNAAEKYNPIKYGSYYDYKPTREYFDWLRCVFQKAFLVLKDGGRLAINIGSKKNGAIPSHAILGEMLTEVGYSFYTTIIWMKGNSSRNSSFGSYLSPSCPSFVTSHEYVIILHKGKRSIGKGQTDLTKNEFVEWTRGVWTFPGVHSEEHPAPFPITLPYRLIKLLTYPGALVVDPFAGRATTGVAAKMLNRRFIGFDIDGSYVRIGNRNIRTGELK